RRAGWSATAGRNACKRHSARIRLHSFRARLIGCGISNCRITDTMRRAQRRARGCIRVAVSGYGVTILSTNSIGGFCDTASHTAPVVPAPQAFLVHWAGLRIFLTPPAFAIALTHAQEQARATYELPEKVIRTYLKGKLANASGRQRMSTNNSEQQQTVANDCCHCGRAHDRSGQRLWRETVSAAWHDWFTQRMKNVSRETSREH